jgi:hypothetical protein
MADYMKQCNRLQRLQLQITITPCLLSKVCTFDYDPLPNMAATGNSCFWLADF